MITRKKLSSGGDLDKIKLCPGRVSTVCQKDYPHGHEQFSTRRTTLSRTENLLIGRINNAELRRLCRDHLIQKFG